MANHPDSRLIATTTAATTMAMDLTSPDFIINGVVDGESLIEAGGVAADQFLKIRGGAGNLLRNDLIAAYVAGFVIGANVERLRDIK